jgi:hypothetical protein
MNKLIISTVIVLMTITQGKAEPAISSWLPSTGKKEASISRVMSKFLKNSQMNFRVLSCQYNDASLSGCKMIDNQEDAWEYKLTTQAVKGKKDALDLWFTIKLKEGTSLSTGIAIAFDAYDWSPENYVMIPASVYNGNRNRIVNREYGQGLDRSDLYKEYLPLTTCAVPQLSPETGTLSRIEVNAGNASTPAICFYDKKNEHAFIILAEQGIRINDEIIDNAFIIEENPDRTIASFIVSAPGVRERKPEFIGFSPSPDRGIIWKAGDSVTMKLRIYSFHTSDVTGLLDRFMSERKEITGTNTPRNLIPFSEISRLMTQNIDARFYESETAHFYCPENADWISFGWIGGLMNTFPMLVLGDEIHRKKVSQTFDFAISNAQGASGYFYGALNCDGKVFGREGYDESPEIVLTRKNADVLFWMLKQFTLLQAQGNLNTIKPEWEQSIQKLADAFVTTWKRHKQWGNFLNNSTGEIAVYNTTSGAMAIGGLALASVYYNHPEYLDIAKEAALYYYNENFLKSGMTTGGCADILQNADSETAAAFMTSLMALYETTAEKEWLDKCCHLANLCATWVVSYDYLLPSDTPLARLGAKLAGAVWASTQNKHGAPGFCTSSGDPLFKIYRATGDKRYADLMYDIAHAHTEGIQPDGHITERLTYCDADSRGSRGDGGKTGWNELNGALMAMELPGIYIRTDSKQCYVFDHVEVKMVRYDQSGITLQITNPTKFNASVHILAENAVQARKPLGYTHFLNWPVVEIKANETVLYRVKADIL